MIQSTVLTQQEILAAVKERILYKILPAMDSNPDNFLFTYGSLREGQFNYNRMKSNYGNDSIIKLCSTDMGYYQMSNLLYFPAIVHTGNYNDRVKGEIMYVSNIASRAIRTMEESAGYVRVKPHVFFMNNDRVSEYKPIYTYAASAVLKNNIMTAECDIVESGDWVKFSKQVELEDVK